MDVDRLKKITGAVRTGGKGTVRRYAATSPAMKIAFVKQH